MDKILLTHGSGGTLMHELIDSLFIKEFDNDILKAKKDSAIIKMGSKRIAFTTDSYVVNPIFFPGADIGSLAVYGTVNDLSVCGAKPLFISIGMIIEEGLDKDILRRITYSIGNACKKARVKIVTGDTKVVERGSCDKIFINTSGMGEVYYAGLSVNNIKPRDKVIVSGPIGDHAVSVLSKREGLAFSSAVKSDSAPLASLIYRILKASKNVRFMRDPTRGGVATTLNEMVSEGSFGIAVEEKYIPLRRGVKEACELLGFDPLYLACEGRVIVVVSEDDAGKVLSVMKRDPLGSSARVIGNITKEYKGKVYLNTISGGRRMLAMLSGEQLPRIC